MSDRIINREIAILAKEIGFDGYCTYFYNVDHCNQQPYKCTSYFDINASTPRNFNRTKISSLVSAPSLSQLQTWLRRCKNMHINPEYAAPDSNQYTIRIDWYEGNQFGYSGVDFCGDTVRFRGEYAYEECLEYGLEKGMLLIKNDNKITIKTTIL